MLFLGIGGMIGATVLSNIATRKKLQYAIDTAEANMLYLDAASDPNNNDVMDPKDYAEGKREVQLYFLANLAKAYGPSLVIGAASVALLVGSNSIQRKRNVALATAYTGIAASFAAYRGRVKTELGDDVDRYLIYKKPFEEPMKVVPASKKVNAVNFDDLDFNDMDAADFEADTALGMPSQYARWFDESSVQWRRTHDMNNFFLRAAQAQMNDELKIRGHVFLNEVYDVLGLPRSSDGAVVGWLDDGTHDCFIDFDLYNPWNQANVDFVNGYGNKILLDFNVDGLIFEAIS